METAKLQTGIVAGSVEAMPPTTFSESTGFLGEDRLRQVIDTALDGMVVIDSSGTVLLYNAACEQLFGYSAQEILGKNVNLLMPHPDRRNHDAYIRNYLRSGEAKIIGIGRDVSGRRKDGSTFPIRLSVGELRHGDDAPLFIGTLHDLTEVLRARDKIEELQSELMLVARVSAVGEMGSTLAHELTQPLSAAMGFVEASAALIDQGNGEGHARVRELMDQAVTQTRRAGDVLRRLREFAGRGDTERSVLDINTVVKEICELTMLGTASESIDLKMILADDLPSVLIDHVQIQQVIHNLVRNSIDALSDSDGSNIFVKTLARGDMVEVSVGDDGPGFPATIRENLFEPFVSTKHDGIGIGLSICRSIVDAHGGKIVVDDNPGRGARISFTIPVFEESNC